MAVMGHMARARVASARSRASTNDVRSAEAVPG